MVMITSLLIRLQYNTLDTIHYNTLNKTLDTLFIKVKQRSLTYLQMQTCYCWEYSVECKQICNN